MSPIMSQLCGDITNSWGCSTWFTTTDECGRFIFREKPFCDLIALLQHPRLLSSANVASKIESSRTNCLVLQQSQFYLWTSFGYQANIFNEARDLVQKWPMWPVDKQSWYMQIEISNTRCDTLSMQFAIGLLIYPKTSMYNRVVQNSCQHYQKLKPFNKPFQGVDGWLPLNNHQENRKMMLRDEEIGRYICAFFQGGANFWAMHGAR